MQTTKPRPAQIVAASFEAGALVERDTWRAEVERMARHLDNNGWSDAALYVRLHASVALESKRGGARRAEVRHG